MVEQSTSTTPDMLLKKSERLILNLAMATLIIGVGGMSLTTTDNRFYLLINVLVTVAFGGIVILLEWQRLPQFYRWPHLYPALQTAFIMLPLLIDWHQPPVFVSLFFLLSVQVMFLMPREQGVLWLILFTVLTTFWNVMYDPSWLLFAGGLVNGAGFFFFGTFASVLVRAEAARRHSQELLGQLEVAHNQLQDYASRIEDLAVAEERNRLSRDLHDTLGHRLTVSIVQLEAAKRLIEQNPNKAGSMVGTVHHQLQEGLSEVRRTVSMLYSPSVTDMSLPAALRQLGRDFATATELNIQLNIPDSLPPLPDSHRLALYRVAQEGLTNIQRHAKAHTVWLQLELGVGSITLSLADDGTGLPAEHQNGGFGLRGIQQRASQLQGSMAVRPRHGGGTELTFHLPRQEYAG